MSERFKCYHVVIRSIIRSITDQYTWKRRSKLCVVFGPSRHRLTVGSKNWGVPVENLHETVHFASGVYGRVKETYKREKTHLGKIDKVSLRWHFDHLMNASKGQKSQKLPFCPLKTSCRNGLILEIVNLPTDQNGLIRKIAKFWRYEALRQNSKIINMSFCQVMPTVQNCKIKLDQGPVS